MQRAQHSMQRALRRARDSASLSHDEAVVLLGARGDVLEDLMASAARVRNAGLQDAGRPGVITYSKKVFIPLTRLCRDRCHYCTFAAAPAQLRREGISLFLEPDEVVAIARAGAQAGCHEALFTLGDRPEDRWPEAREWLEQRGYSTTLDYLRAMAIHVLEETGLLPHLNPGVMSWDELQRLKPVAPSMGMMLEQSAQRLFTQPGAVHFGSPDKDPEVRMRTIDDAGRLSIPFTTGVLVGIGETPDELIDALLQIRRSAREFGHVQEVIVQNFRAKPDTAMRDAADLPEEDYLAALAVSRLLLGPGMRLQAPPNLSSPEALASLLAAGVDDWGGVSPLTPDHVNPERPWPHLEQLAELTAAAGFTLRQRLTAHPEYLARGEPWVDPRLVPHIRALADPQSLLAQADVRPQGIPWQMESASYEVIGSGGRTDLATAIDHEGRRSQQRGDAESAFGNWTSIADRISPAIVSGSSDVQRALTLAADDPAALADERHHQLATALMSSDGAVLDELCLIADSLRTRAVGDVVTYVVNRNINFTNICYTGCRFCAFAQREGDADAYTLSLDQIAERAVEAQALGATEVCLQGGIHPRLPGTAYFDILRAVREAAPDLHIHAFSPMEIANGAARSDMSVEQWLTQARAAGLSSIPGTAAEILDDEVRWVLTRGKLPAQQWIEIVSTAHRLGIPSSSTMMYGHVDHPGHWVAHLRTLRRIQERTGGFTEFVPLPFVHRQSPVYLAGLARPGPTPRDNRAVHAMARVLLHEQIAHVQASWVKLGDPVVVQLLQGGADDLGGTLMEETISRMAGSEYGSQRTVADLAAMAAAAGRPVRQRTTTYAAASVDSHFVGISQPV